MSVATIISDLRKAATAVDPVLSFALVALAATGIGGPVAEEAVAIIQAAAKSLEGATSGAQTSEQVLAHLDAIHAALAANVATAQAVLDAAAAALAARFPAGA